MESKAAGKLTEEQVAEIKKEFDMYDKNGDGVITPAELRAVLRSFGQNLTESELKAVMAVVDTDGNGVIDFTEFLNAMAEGTKDFDPEKSLRGIFKLFDKDQDGYISAAELRNLTAGIGQPVTDEEAKAMIKAADLDGDGMVNFEEFFKMFRK